MSGLTQGVVRGRVLVAESGAAIKLTYPLDAVDLKKEQALVRAAELENVRLAARILHGEREDPSIEKKVVVEGTSPVVVSDE